MARTTTKTITYLIEDTIEREAFLSQIRVKVKFVDLQIFFKSLKINITVRGPRERVLYAIHLIRKIREDVRPENID